MPVTIADKKPTITWNYADGDSRIQPQAWFRVLVTRSAAYDQEVLWDSGQVESDQASVKYNFDNKGKELPSHETLRLLIQASDGLDDNWSDPKEFVVSGVPLITICTVDDKLNPLNLKDLQPVFKWKYTDLDSDPLLGYEIRVGDALTDLGTDAYPGNVWHPGPKTLPNPHESTFGPGAFPGCMFPKQLQKNVIYYFQLQVWDAYQKSFWYTGYFRLNNPPTVSGLQVLPAVPYGNDNLEAYYEFHDDAGETESDKTQIRWYKNNIEVMELRQSKIVDASLTEPGQSWFFTVMPNDGVDYGNVYPSPRVVISNRPPTMTILGIDPALPRVQDELEALFAVSDPDGDDVAVTISWFKNGLEQSEYRNRTTVPGGFSKVGDEWFFEAQADDGYAKSPIARSQAVKIVNTAPQVNEMRIEGAILPKTILVQTPLVSWQYYDLDAQPQSAYRVLIGSRPPLIKQTRLSESWLPPNPFDTGILSEMDEIQEGSGMDVADSGVVLSSDKSWKRAFSEQGQSYMLGPINSLKYINYTLESDLTTTSLKILSQTGQAVFSFQGEAGTYEATIEYIGEQNKNSTYRLVVDGLTVDEFSSEAVAGTRAQTFKAARLSKGSQVTIVGVSDRNGGRAAFTSLRLTPVLSFTVQAKDMRLFGYADAGDGTIKLVGSAGYAQTTYQYPRNKYDIEIHYETEDTGTPASALSINGTSVFSWTFETGSMERIKYVYGIDITPGDLIRITSTRNGNALARISKLVFVPSAISGAAVLKPGFTYYASVRVSDGMAWSPWYVTKFSMKGSAWVSSVSNQTGWTIDFRARLFSVAAPTEATTAATTTPTTTTTTTTTTATTTTGA